MKKSIAYFVLATACFLVCTGQTRAGTTDTDSLDRVSVLMHRSQIMEILGLPHETHEAGKGLTTETYRISDAETMVGAALVYKDTDHLAGQAFVFHGALAWQIAELMKERGFQYLDEQDCGSIRLSGQDKDSGHSLVAVIVQGDDHTTVMTFEEEFYGKKAGRPFP